MTNVVFVILDALRYDHATREGTPNLMAVADDGAFFTHAFSCNSSTNLSMPCILSSAKKHDPERNIAKVLGDKNYRTAIIHSNPLMRAFYPGFEVTIDIKSSPLKLRKGWKKAMRRALPAPVISGLKKIRAEIYDDERYLPYARAGETAEHALDWMGQNQGYFLWIHVMDPHIPYYPKENSLGMTPKEMMELNDKIVEAAHGNYRPTEEEVEAARTLYGDEVREMDADLGRLYDGVGPDDLLVVTSDHGEEFNEYGQFSHQGNKIIPQLIHVPLIFHGCGVRRNTVIDDYVSSLDIAPTVLDALGIGEKLGLGRSLWALISPRPGPEAAKTPDG
ncbi:hypothetical protein AC482_06955 [miscellaneous Crenarchaeota group-15 archaeon DG-45]|uniref:Sulfatase N-terminal domain-containing protein n=1 Tax=miscellaneous Crenarchaeota group-15 archaeon DG-45 TaxID=1685127 RepID=A0A0M0BLP9_9ARCH|nr:MAG: hypothetical protein AC482_06955 [miscellaneous Crenarchaeota group-15 archaeon DG-45]